MLRSARFAMIDPAPEKLFEQYLAVTTDLEAEQCLAQILEQLATPLVRRVISSAMRDSACNDAEDVVSDTLLDLLRKLRALRRDPELQIHDLRRYIVTCAYNRCHERLRERHPVRVRLRNQLRYLCEHDRELALWRDCGELVCGFREWNGHSAANAIDDIQLVATNDPTAENRAQTAMLVHDALYAARRPITLNALTAQIAKAIGIDERPAPLTTFETSLEPAADEILETRISLQQLWDDVCKLAWKQRIALLLNLRDVQGRECLTLLPLTRIATIPEIASVLGMPVKKFASLWNELPLNDVAIARLLDVTPRQVIKFRRLARERLRRMSNHREHRNVTRKLDSSQSGTTLVTRR